MSMGTTLHILSALFPNWRIEAILPYEVDSVEFYSQSLFFGDLDILGVLRDREWHVLDGEGRHLVFHTLLEEVALL